MINEGVRSDPGLAARVPDLARLIDAAAAGAASAHAPYSGYRVGAAVLDDRGVVTKGCNVEPAASAATLCAERAAIGAAIANGATSVTACVTVTRDEDPASCCGVCRQLLAEVGPDAVVINASLTSDRVRWGSIADWLPFGFDGSSLAAPPTG